ncbi:hypothetical protein AX15_002574 [Amanita polypyramis BW_CC]|nr:hypothetical protein AX15_002574 [Amanita polypyramis BW_CC]
MLVCHRGLLICRPQHTLSMRGLTLQANQHPRACTSRYASVALLAAFACGVSAYLFLPSAPSRAAPTSTTEQLSAQHFTPSTVMANNNTTPDSKVLALRVDPALVPPHFMRHLTLSPSDEATKKGDARIYSIFVKDSDIQVERPYTPLECANEDGNLIFWVKKYGKSEVARWIHARKAGDLVELRGPVVTWDWSWRPCEGGWDEVVMISGGTGITPFYQFLHSMFAYPSKLQGDKSTRYTLLHSSKTSADLPPPSILDPLTSFAAERPDVFKMHLFVDSAPGGSLTDPRSLRVGRIGRTAIERSLGLTKDDRSWGWMTFWRKKEEPPRKKVLFLVCGPESCVIFYRSYWKCMLNFE